MELERLINKLESCHMEGEDQKVFLLARDNKEAGAWATSGPVGDARDRDIWSLVGPVTMDSSQSSFKFRRRDLKVVKDELARIAVEEEPKCGQKLFVLVREKPDPNKSKRARDRDIWSLTEPLPAGSAFGATEAILSLGRGERRDESVEILQ